MKILMKLAFAAALLNGAVSQASAASWLYQYNGFSPAKDFSFIIDDSILPRIGLGSPRFHLNIGNITSGRDPNEGLDSVLYQQDAKLLILGGSGEVFFDGGTSIPLLALVGTKVTPYLWHGEILPELPAANGNGDRGYFTVKEVSAVPEPATWAMMLLGMGAVGFAMRRRSAIKTTVSYA